MEGTPTYNTWAHMLTRCRNEGHKQYADYGGRGIVVCERWHVFENFLADMGKKPAGKSLDRIDNDGNYEPGNCRWATHTQQMRNRRKTVRADGVAVSEIAEKHGIKTKVLRERLKRGLPMSEAVSNIRRNRWGKTKSKTK